MTAAARKLRTIAALAALGLGVAGCTDPYSGRVDPLRTGLLGGLIEDNQRAHRYRPYGHGYGYGRPYYAPPVAAPYGGYGYPGYRGYRGWAW
jgi:hypothetical protein